MKYLALVKYLGTDFHGFQVQPDKRTVQGELCRALSEALGGECTVTGCSRTDAGVHANEFCILAVCKEATVPPDKLPLAVARFLPSDLSLFHASEAPEGFHPRYDAKSKEYLYRIKNSPIYDPFDFGRVWFLPRKIDDTDIENMRSAASHLTGRHDFSSFMTVGADVSDTVRTVHYLDIESKNGYIDIKIAADGFLYNMVRIIVGTLIEVAYKRVAPDEMKSILEACDRSMAGMTAPPMGLYLNSIKY